MNNDKLYTISEFAKKVGLSRQAVYKRLNTDLSTHVVNVDNKQMLKSSAFSVVKLSTESEKVSTLSTIEALEKMIKFMEKEVEQLRAENEALRSENGKLVTELMSLSSRVGASLEQLTSTNLANALLEAHQLQEKKEIEVVEQKKSRGFFGLFHKKGE